ncbi:unnamed protein product [Knipowitschia caucasica]
MELLNLTSANLTNSTGSPAHFIWKAEKMVPAVIMSVCFLVGFPGNVAALILRPWQQLSTLTQCLMVNLASSDLLCLVTLLFWFYALCNDWAFGAVGCKIVTFLTYCSIYSSVLTVTALSVQRYMQVVHPHRSLQFKKRRLVLMWLMSMVLSTPMLAFRQIIVDQQKNFCVSHYSSQPQQLAVILTEFTLGFSSFIICMWVYITLNRKLTQTTFFNSPSTFKLLTAVTITFLVLWLPVMIFDLVIIIDILSNSLKIVKFYDSGLLIFSAFVYINSSLNPLLYAFASGLCKRNRNIQQE